MKVFVLANRQQEKELQTTGILEKKNIIIKKDFPANGEYKNYDAFLILRHFSDDINFAIFENKPVIINEVVQSLKELKLPQNFHRINGWPGFLQRETWEIVSYDPQKIKPVLDEFNRKTIYLKDEAGFVSARVISMIINEAFYALGEGVSTKEEIDLAMKSGTNYPYGPFEWTEKIGPENILNLLEKLSQKEERYLPARALKNLC